MFCCLSSTLSETWRRWASYRRTEAASHVSYFLNVIFLRLSDLEIFNYGPRKLPRSHIHAYITDV